MKEPKGKCQMCGAKTNNLRTVRNYKGEMKWVCLHCFYGVKL